MDDLWFPDAKYTNDDDFCSTLVHGWELGWYWAEEGWMEEMHNIVDIWFSRETGAADFCLADSSENC